MPPKDLFKKDYPLDNYAIIGICVSIAAVAIGQVLEGGHFLTLMNGPAFIIVMGGTIGAVLLETPRQTFMLALQRLFLVFKPPTYDISEIIAKLTSWSHRVRQDGVLSLERALEEESDPFLIKSLMLLTASVPAPKIRDTLQLDIDHKLAQEQQAARVFESMGGYAPTVGILGAVIGLIEVMRNLSEPSKLGAGISVAFVATVYGISLANLLFIPIANKMHRLADDMAHFKSLILAGVIAISEGDPPVAIEIKLSSCKETPWFASDR